MINNGPMPDNLNKPEFVVNLLAAFPHTLISKTGFRQHLWERITFAAVANPSSLYSEEKGQVKHSTNEYSLINRHFALNASAKKVIITSKDHDSVGKYHWGHNTLLAYVTENL